MLKHYKNVAHHSQSDYVYVPSSQPFLCLRVYVCNTMSCQNAEKAGEQIRGYNAPLLFMSNIEQPR